jgi:hypothetical protein
VHGFNQDLKQRSRGQRPVLEQRFAEAFLAEFVSIRRRCFGQAIGVQQEDISGVEL